MRILWASTAPWAGSGYGVQTAMTTARLQTAGHSVAIACNKGLEGNVLHWPGPREAIPLFPAGQNPRRHNMDKVAQHAEQFEADVIISHYDAWCLDQKRLDHDAFTRPWVPWFPIDTDDVASIVLNAVRGLRGAAYRITQTRHGQAAMHSHNEQCAYVPAGYDATVFHPADPQAAKRELGLEGRFVVAMVAANSGTPDAPSRKSFPQVFQAWQWFVEKHPDSVLYIHAMPQGHLNLDAMAEEYQIRDNLLFADPYYLYAGMFKADDMARIYNAADVLLNPSMGEGFGVPIVEAQACGTPVITGDWTAMSEVTKTGYRIPQEQASRYQMVGYGGDMFLPRSEAILDALEQATTWAYDPQVVSESVSEYEAAAVWRDHWRPALREVEDLLGLREPASVEVEETNTAIRAMLMEGVR